MPQTAERRPAGNGTAIQNHDRAGHGQRSAPAIAATSVDRPCPGRDLWTYRVVDRRGHVHLHRGGPPTEDGHLREAPCGEVYRIVCAGAGWTGGQPVHSTMTSGNAGGQQGGQ